MRVFYSLFICFLFYYSNSQDLIEVIKNGKYGCIDRKGNFIIEPIWDYIFFVSSNEPILVQKDSLYGFINRKGQVLIKPQFYDGDLFSEGLAKVADKNRKYGYINLKGQTIIPFRYEEKAWGEFSRGLADVTFNERSGYIDNKGNIVIPFIFEICYPFKSDRAVVMDTLHKFHLIDKLGRLYDYNQLNIGKRRILPPYDRYPGIIKTKSGQGRVNKNGDTIVPPIYLVTGNHSDDMYIVQDLNKKWGAYNSKGKLVLTPQFDYLWHFKEGLANFEINKKWGFVNRKGKIVIEAKFDRALEFRKGLAYVEINGKSGFINKNGKFVINPIFDINLY